MRSLKMTKKQEQLCDKFEALINQMWEANIGTVCDGFGQYLYLFNLENVHHCCSDFDTDGSKNDIITKIPMCTKRPDVRLVHVPFRAYYDFDSSWFGVVFKEDVGKRKTKMKKE